MNTPHLASQSVRRPDRQETAQVIIFWIFETLCPLNEKCSFALLLLHFSSVFWALSFNLLVIFLVWWGISYCCLFNILLKCYFANFFRTIKQYTNDFHHHKLSYIFKILIRGMYNKVGNCTGKYLLGKQQYSRIE